MVDATGFLSEFVSELDLDAIPPQVLTNAKRSFVDTFACAFIGSLEETGQIVSGYGRENAGAGVCSVLGKGGYRTSPADAALVNGTLAHALDYDDTYSTIRYASVGKGGSGDATPEGMSIGHMGSCLLPAVLAIGEKVGASGRDILLAYVAGFETACRLGNAMGFQHYAKGYHSTSTLGSMAAAAAAGKLLGANAGQLRATFGIAAAQAGGLRGNFGTMAKPLQAGNGAKAGVFAALLADKGFTAADDIVGGELGFLDVLSLGGGNGAEEVIAEPDGGFYLLTGNSLKFLPCGNALQSSLETMIELARQHDVNPEDVESVNQTVLMPRYRVCTKDGVTYQMPRSGLEGKFVLPFGLAAALADRKISLSTYKDETVRRPELRKLFEKTKITHDPEAGRESLSIQLVDGTKIELEIGPSKGHWSSEFPEHMLKDKFVDCVQAAAPSINALELYESAVALESVPTIRDITAMARAA